MPEEAVFNALADATRRDVMQRLADNGPCTATTLAADMPITRQAVAKHLTLLHRAGLVQPQRQGRETLYRLTTDPLSDAIDWLHDVCGRVNGAKAA